MADTGTVLQAAQARGTEQMLPYDGALLPSEAQYLRQELPDTVIVDVRTKAEWNYVGRIPDSIEVEWQTYPGGQPNENFLSQLEALVPRQCTVLFICRSGARSHAAAAAAKSAGYARCFNILQGFEGDRDAQGHRNTVGGWRAAGLPWYQS